MFTFNKNEEDPYCSVKEIQEKDVKTRICVNLVFSEILNLDQTQEAGGEGEEQGDQPGYCVGGEAEEGGAGDQVGDVDQVHEEDHLEEGVILDEKSMMIDTVYLFTPEK